MDESPQQFIYFLRPTRLEMLTEGPTAEETRLQAEHGSYLARLAAHDVVMLAGRTTTNDANTVGIVIINAADEGAAREIMERDPFVKNSIMNVTLFPFRVAYRGK